MLAFFFSVSAYAFPCIWVAPVVEDRKTLCYLKQLRCRKEFARHETQCLDPLRIPARPPRKAVGYQKPRSAKESSHNYLHFSNAVQLRTYLSRLLRILSPITATISRMSEIDVKLINFMFVFFASNATYPLHFLSLRLEGSVRNGAKKTAYQKICRHHSSALCCLPGKFEVEAAPQATTIRTNKRLVQRCRQMGSVLLANNCL